MNDSCLSRLKKRQLQRKGRTSPVLKYKMSKNSVKRSRVMLMLENSKVKSCKVKATLKMFYSKVKSCKVKATLKMFYSKVKEGTQSSK